MKIYVTKEHIKRGEQFACAKCPIALAMRDACLPKFSVNGHWASLQNHIPQHVILPRSAQRFVRRFDAGKPVKPFAFIVRTKPQP